MEHIFIINFVIPRESQLMTKIPTKFHENIQDMILDTDGSNMTIPRHNLLILGEKSTQKQHFFVSKNCRREFQAKCVRYGSPEYIHFTTDSITLCLLLPVIISLLNVHLKCLCVAGVKFHPVLHSQCCYNFLFLYIIDFNAFIIVFCST